MFDSINVSIPPLFWFQSISELLYEDPKGDITINEQRHSISWTESDSRSSAIATGTVVGLLCCVIPIAAMIILDLPAVLRDLLRMAYNITGNEKFNWKRQTKEYRDKERRDAEPAEKRSERRLRANLEAKVDVVTEVSED